jgi:hypothetical protein
VLVFAHGGANLTIAVFGNRTYLFSGANPILGTMISIHSVASIRKDWNFLR